MNPSRALNGVRAGADFLGAEPPLAGPTIHPELSSLPEIRWMGTSKIANIGKYENYFFLDDYYLMHGDDT